MDELSELVSGLSLEHGPGLPGSSYRGAQSHVSAQAWGGEALVPAGREARLGPVRTAVDGGARLVPA